MENTTGFSCKECQKQYTRKSTLTNHIKTKHPIVFAINCNQNENKTEIKPEKKIYNCRYCNTYYTFPSSRCRHEKKCKTQSNLSVKEEVEKLKVEITELQNKLLKMKRIDKKTFKSVNKILMDRSYKNMMLNNSNNTNNTSTNTIINNYGIVSLGKEDILNTLTMQQKKQIINAKMMSLEKIIEITHCGEINQFKNIIITNLKDNYAYSYDETKGYFVTVPKNILIDDLVNHRLSDIEDIYEELQTANKIDAKTKKIIQDFLDKIGNEENPFYDDENKYENFKSFKINSVKVLLYNNQDKITRDIALLVSS